VRVFSDGSQQEVWTRQFERGFVIVSSIEASNFTLKLSNDQRKQFRPLPLSVTPHRLTDQREAPAWQLVIDNDLHSAPLRNRRARTVMGVGAACVCSVAAPACCTHAPGRPQDWWAGAARRAGFRIVGGNWTTVTDSSQSHQVGNSFAVSFVEPGPQPQGAPPVMEAAYHFVAPSTDGFFFAMTAVNAHLYPLSDGVKVCVREVAQGVAEFDQPCSSPCIAAGTIDQRGGNGDIRDGRWQRALSGVKLQFNHSYEFVVAWDPLRGGYAAVDALLIESETLYHGGAATDVAMELTVGAMDSRILALNQQLRVKELDLY
jgi:hypothetical protein